MTPRDAIDTKALLGALAVLVAREGEVRITDEDLDRIAYGGPRITWHRNEATKETVIRALPADAVTRGDLRRLAGQTG